MGGTHSQRSQHNEYDGQDEEEAKQDFGNASRTRSKASKTQGTGNQGNHRKNDGVFQHDTVFQERCAGKATPRYLLVEKS
jgi:hypothetical protein